MFMPNSPRPPKGIAKSDCRDLLNELSAPKVEGKSYHRDGSSRPPAATRLWASLPWRAGEQTRNAHQNQRACRCRTQRIIKVTAHDAKVGEQPTADHGADKPENDVGNAAKSAAAE